MKASLVKYLTTLSLVLVFSIAASACGNAATTTSAEKPVANITSPATNSNFTAGQEILITFSAADVKGINQVELVIDGEAVMVETVNPPVNSYTASHRWVAEGGGSHVVELRAFNVDGVPSDPAQIFVLVAGAAVEATPTPPPATSTSTPTVEVINPVVLPLPTPTEPAPTTEPTSTQAIVTALVRLNVRQGPATDYPVIGRLNLNESAPITGRDQISAWWQIEFPAGSSERGWVAAGGEFSSAANVNNVPVVEAPPLASITAPTPTLPPTVAPNTNKPTIFNFTADRYTIAAGETVELRWDLANAQAAFLRYDGEEEGVVAPGTKIVSPDKETKYTLIARNEVGETIAEVVIKIAAPGETPVPVLRDGKVRIANGQFLDFDQGLVQPGPDVTTDFQWDGQTKQFVPLNGAIGTLINKTYGDITFADCKTAAYDKPISGVDGSAPVRGCYRTSEARYGKFLISEWDLAFNLTVEWLTWNAQ